MVHTRSLCLTAALAGLSAVKAIPTIEVKGSKFFTSEGNQFYVKGTYTPISAHFTYASIEYS